MDLLGYEEEIDRLHQQPDKIRLISDGFQEALNFFESAKSRDAKTPYALANKIIAERTVLTLISDSVLIRMPLPDALDPVSTELSGSQNAYVCSVAFLSYVAEFYLWFAGKFSYFFRGAITVGQHFESAPVNPRNLFVFSKALVDAFKLGSQKGNPPRLILHQDLIRYLSRLKKDVPADWPLPLEFLDGEKTCLDIYFWLKPGHEGTQKILSDVLKKYEWFSSFHNQRLKNLGFPSLSIQI